MRFLELHSVQWGPIQGSSALCVRLDDSLFDVRIDRSRRSESSYWFAPGGLPPFELPTSEPFVLGGLLGRFIAIVSEDEADPDFPEHCGLTVRIRLHIPMPSVAFVPDPNLALANGITFEAATALANPEGTVLINWISEDADAWFFNYFSFGYGALRVAKRDGSVTPTDHSIPIPGQLDRGGRRRLDPAGR